MSDDSLNCSDLDRIKGVPIQPGRMREPFSNTDIRRWVQAMRYPNRLHYDPDFAADSRFGSQVAPQSFPVAMDDGHGTATSCIGSIPNSHMIFGGDEWWFYGPRVYAGDMLHNHRVPFDYAVKETSFAGPTCFQRGDNYYYNQEGELIAKQRSTSIRYRPDLAREMGAWILDYFAGWAGEWGSVVHSNCAYRGPAFSGDITVMTATVTGKTVDDEGRHLVQLDFEMTNQSQTTMATARADIELPGRT